MKTFPHHRHAARPFAIYLLAVYLILLAVGGFMGAYHFLTDPTGASIGFSQSFAKMLPVPNFILPGIFLLLAFGILPLVIAWIVLLDPIWARMKPLEARTHEHWAWSAAMALSLLLVGWMAFQLLLTGFYAPIQAVTSIWGLAMVGILLLPSVRRYFRTR
ncbi:hypothetical protein [Tellurirhabdus rosea]|uniref:hypothetical protein n=1 Tax=Tellurirhabdus rosea TaxID=2674997 RepID=UPI0022520D31|nr:hypothetical protein [Tellurirhabdus rosea]